MHLSADPQQRFLYVADGTNNHIWILDRNTLQVLGKFGWQGRYAGQFHHSHNVAVDSKGDVYVAETLTRLGLRRPRTQKLSWPS